jgi:Tfp pilus assembly protein PilV
VNAANLLRGGRGFTLVEVLIAAVLLVAVIIPLMTSFLNATRWTSEAKGLLTAAYLAQSKLEEVKNKPFGEVQNDPPDSDNPPVPFAGYPDYAYRITITEYTGDDPDLTGHLKTVTVTVFYATPGGKKTVSLTMEKGDR